MYVKSKSIQSLGSISRMPAVGPWLQGEGLQPLMLQALSLWDRILIQRPLKKIVLTIAVGFESGLCKTSLLGSSYCNLKLLSPLWPPSLMYGSNYIHLLSQGAHPPP
ncbi:hypothetical protein KIL84_016818 [Mauremys mutica]|uniref:Uncharacterized protein n=1 Tax=Mauremys mutica TaxID=74926 RepID=A0A9D4AWT7_9SAUR|nr:hypothetical protein KIL84_016818 [Mauremys mutica]